MSQGSKKGVALSTKSNLTKLKKEECKNKDIYKNDLFRSFHSLSSLSVTNQENNKDDSVVYSDTSVNSIVSHNNETDVFEFPNKKNSSLFKNRPVALSESNSPNCKNNDVKVKDILWEETKLSLSLNGCTGSLKTEPNSTFDDSLLLFKSDVKASEKGVDKVSGSIEANGNTENDVASNCDDEVPICTVNLNKKNPVLKDDLIRLPSELKSEPINQCPICLKTVQKYVSHMKSCAAKNRISTQQLLSALKLHKKQIAERQELGLGLPAPSFRAKVSPKKSRALDVKGPVDSSLQLALALSASLRAAEEDEVIQEAEVLQEAGLCEEADKKLSTLENFGFASALPPKPKTVQGRYRQQSVLLGRSKEERERIITEKVAIVLISEDEIVDLEEFKDKNLVIKSKLLKELWNKESELWVKAQSTGQEDRSAFYVQSLSEHVSPSKAEVGEGLRRLSQLPGRLNTPGKESFFDLPTPPKSNIPETEFSELPTPARSEVKHGTASITDPSMRCKMSADWKAFVNNPVMSDVEVQCCSGLSVVAHKLVLQVRCPNILNQVQRRDNTDVIVWDNCSKTSVLAFLEFIYSGKSDSIFHLDPADYCCVSDLAEQFDCSELKSCLRIPDKTSRGVTIRKSKHGDSKRKLFGAKFDTQTELCTREYLSHSKSIIPLNNSLIEIHQESSLINTSEFRKSTQNTELFCASSSDGRGSPDMFCESALVLTEPLSHDSRDDLDILASLVDKNTPEIKLKPDMKKSSFDNNSIKDLSISLSSSTSTSNKRKAENNSFSEDEDVSLSKKLCSDFSQTIPLKDLENDEMFDLTQSSDSSNEESREMKQRACESEVFSLETNNFEELDKDDYLEDLTQRNPSDSSKTPTTTNYSGCQDYIDPVWDGFEDDYLHFNYDVNSPMKTPVRQKSSVSTCFLTTPGKRSDPSTNVSPKCTYISSDSKSPKKLSETTLSSSCKSSPDNKNISCDSFSPMKLSQRTLDNSSSQSTRRVKDNCKDLGQFSSGSDVEFVGKQSPNEYAHSNNSKRRTNLISKFDLTQKSPLKVISIRGNKAPQTTNTSGLPLQKSSQEHKEDLPKSPVKKDSLQRFFDDSLDVSESVFVNADAILASGKEENKKQEAERSSSTCQVEAVDKCGKRKCSVSTPSPEVIVSDIVTPLADYSAMKTPSLKKELSRFGLKPSLGRRKAKLLLRYIYDQTHPLVPVDSSKNPATSPGKTQSDVHIVDLESDADLPCSQKSSSSDSSVATLPEESFCEPEDFLTQELSTSGDVRTSIKSLIFCNAELHRQVLMYEPIYLEELMATLKTNGIKSKVNDVMDFLDEQCITFRTTSWKATNEKRRQKQRSPKKTTKEVTGCGISGKTKKPTTPKKMSPSNATSHVVKKRGRPRKTNSEVDL